MNKEKIEELNKIIKENPELEIKFLVKGEVVENDDFIYWGCEIDRIDISLYHIYDDNIVMDEYTLREHIHFKILKESEPKYNNYSDSEMEELVNEKYKMENPHKFIILYLI